MAHSTTNTAVDDVLNTYLNKAFVADLEYDLQHQKFTLKGDVPAGMGNILRFNEFTAPNRTGYTTGTTPLTEGTTSGNEITQITITPSNLTLSEFGEFIKVTSFYDIAAQKGTRERLRKRLRDGANVALDSYTYVKSRGTTNILYAVTGAQGAQASAPATIGALGATAIMFAKKTLKDGLATPFTGIPNHPDNDFAAVLTEKQEFDVVSEITTGRAYWSNGVVNVPGRLGQEKIIRGYMGSWYGVACYATNNYGTWASTSPGSEIGYVYGEDGIGAASLADMQPEIILNDVNSPYKNMNSIAWHTFYEAALLRSASVIKLYSSQ